MAIRSVLELRAGVRRRLRDFFDDRGFLEVDTPVLSAEVVPDAILSQLKEGGRLGADGVDHHETRRGANSRAARFSRNFSAAPVGSSSVPTTSVAGRAISAAIAAAIASICSAISPRSRRTQRSRWRRDTACQAGCACRATANSLMNGSMTTA